MHRDGGTLCPSAVPRMREGPFQFYLDSRIPPHPHGRGKGGG